MATATKHQIRSHKTYQKHYNQFSNAQLRFTNNSIKKSRGTNIKASIGKFFAKLFARKAGK